MASCPAVGDLVALDVIKHLFLYKIRTKETTFKLICVKSLKFFSQLIHHCSSRAQLLAAIEENDLQMFKPGVELIDYSSISSNEALSEATVSYCQINPPNNDYTGICCVGWITGACGATM